MQIKYFYISIANIGKLGKVGCNFSQVINLLYQCIGYTAGKFFYIGLIIINRFLQVLNAQLHRCKGIFNLMCHLPGHFSPGPFPFTFCQCDCTISQLGHHFIIFIYQLTNLIVPVPWNFFIQLAKIYFFHFIAN